MKSLAKMHDFQSSQTDLTCHIWMRLLLNYIVLPLRILWQFLIRQREIHPLRDSLSLGIPQCLLIFGEFTTILITGGNHLVFGRTDSWMNRGDCMWKESCLSLQEYVRVSQKSFPKEWFSCSLRDCYTDLDLSVRMVKSCPKRKTWLITGFYLIVSRLG